MGICIILKMPQPYQTHPLQRHFLSLVTFVIIICSIFDAVATQNVDPGKPLYLSPLIEAGELSQAMDAAFTYDFLNVISYSGFITVNSTYNSNLFFWFFPAEVRIKSR